MRLPGVRTAADAPVTLLFAESGVHVLSASGWCRRLFRAAGGAVFAAVALAGIGLGVGHSVEPALGIALTAAGLALAVGAGAAATTGWILSIRAERALRDDRVQPHIAVEHVAWARSTQEDGHVRVVVGTAGGDSHEFSAGGFTGVHLARQFGLLVEAADAHRFVGPTPEDTQQS